MSECDLCPEPAAPDSALCDGCAWDVAEDQQGERELQAGRDARA